MIKPKLFLYRNRRPHAHDKDPSGIYVNTVPMSEIGISEHFELSYPEDADYFYMGQFNNDASIHQYSPSSFEFLKGMNTSISATMKEKEVKNTEQEDRL